jgi:hypothetical protein
MRDRHKGFGDSREEQIGKRFGRGLNRNHFNSSQEEGKVFFFFKGLGAKSSRARN